MASTDIGLKIATIDGITNFIMAQTTIFLERMAEEMELGYTPIAPPDIWVSPASVTIDADMPTRPDLTIPAIAVPAGLTTLPGFDLPFPDDSDIAVPSNISFTEQKYISTLLDTVKAKLLSDVQAGSTGLAPSVETAIFDRQAERDIQLKNDAIDNEISKWSMRGFTLPNDVIDARLEEIETKFYDSRLDRSRDIAVNQAELAQKNSHFVITSSLTLETMAITHSENVNNRALTAAKTIAEVGVLILNAMINKHNSRLEAYKTKAITYTEIEKAKIDYHIARIQKYKTEVEANVAKISGYADIYRADAAAYSAIVSKGEAEGRLRVAQQEMVIQNIEKQMMIKLDASKANLSAFLEAAKVRIGAAQAGGNFWSAMGSSALQSISAILQKVEETTIQE